MFINDNKVIHPFTITGKTIELLVMSTGKIDIKKKFISLFLNSRTGPFNYFLLLFLTTTLFRPSFFA